MACDDSISVLSWLPSQRAHQLRQACTFPHVKHFHGSCNDTQCVLPGLCDAEQHEHGSINKSACQVAETKRKKRAVSHSPRERSTPKSCQESEDEAALLLGGLGIIHGMLCERSRYVAERNSRYQYVAAVSASRIPNPVGEPFERHCTTLTTTH